MRSLKPLLAESITVVYLGFIALLAEVTHLPYVLFPELGALSHDVLKRPEGTWASAPMHLISTPFFGGCAGVVVARMLPYGISAVLLATLAALLIITILNSPIVPAISASVLPVSLGIQSWMYPVSLLLGLTVLVLLSKWLNRAAESAVVATQKRRPLLLGRFLIFLLFIVCAAALSTLTGWRLILFPPLIVIAYEMLAHPAHCSWAEPVWILPVACTLSALAGAALASRFGHSYWLVILSALSAVVLLRGLRSHIPPVLAIALLPFVIPAADFTFVISVALGTSLLALFSKIGKEIGVL